MQEVQEQEGGGPTLLETQERSGLEEQNVREKEGRVPTVPAPIEVDRGSQGLIAKNNTELVRIIKIMMQGSALPKTLDTEAKVIAAWNMAAALKVPPAIAIQNMAVINGTVMIWGQLPKALAEATGELKDFSVVLIDAEQKPILLSNQNLKSEPWGAVCRIRRGERSTNEYIFTMDDAKKAGLDKKSGPWRDYTKIMLQRRAVAQAIKFEFPDALMGLGIAEYETGEAPDIKDVTPSQNRDALIEKLNNRAQPKEGHDVSVKKGTGINLEASE